MKERRARSSKTNNLKIDQALKLEKQIEEDLISENQKLRMKVEYLKKLSALVLADEQEKAKKQQ